MADRVFLHIGAHKTGTSYLQRMVWANRAVLEEMGLSLAMSRRAHHFDAVADLRGGLWAESRLSTTWDEIVADIAKRPGSVLISEELLCAAEPPQMQRIVDSLAPAEVHVVHAARDIGRQLPSQWQQSLRARGVGTYAAYLSGLQSRDTHPFWSIQDPVAVHARWAPYVAPGRFHLVTLPPRGAPTTTLWERFAAVVGVDPTRATAPDKPQNESLGLVQSELLRRFNAQLGEEFPMRAPYVKGVLNNLIRPALLGTGGEAIGVPPGYGGWVVQRADAMVDQVAALAEAGSLTLVGDLEDLRAQAVESRRAPEDVPEAEILEAALAAWTRQIGVLSAQQERVLAARTARRAKRAARQRRVKVRVRQRARDSRRAEVEAKAAREARPRARLRLRAGAVARRVGLRR